MRKSMPIEEPGDVDLIPVVPQHHYDAPCRCGHRHAEHSMFGSCHGCNDCDGDAGVAEHEHAYQRCSCTSFELAVHADDLALTG